MVILCVGKPRGKGLFSEVKAHGGLNSWNTRQLGGGGSIPSKTIDYIEEKETLYEIC